MKRFLFILALCGSVHAGSYCDDYSEQLNRIEEQQEEILRRQQHAEWAAWGAAQQAKAQADKQRQWDDINRWRQQMGLEPVF